MAAAKFLTILLPFLIIAMAMAMANEDSRDLDKFGSPFAFIEHLKGCQKGDKSQGILQLKLYLKNLGYLNFDASVDTDPMDFDLLLEFAVRIYQLNYGLLPTGILDSDTIAKMMMPRCGVPDIINGTNWMGYGRRHGRSIGSFHSVSHYSFFPGSPKWPASKNHLTYAFVAGTPGVAVDPVARAFKTWSTVTKFTFTQAWDTTKSDIVIGFKRGNHGDGSNFDGKGGILAHAFSPPTGWFHIDADEPWSVGAVPGKYDLQTVALHEIGHLLGLEHSSDPNTIMYPIIDEGATKGLHEDDIQGIKALYDV